MLPDAGPVPTCESPPTIATGASEGHPEPLASSPSEARAGRLSSLPDDPSGLLRWAVGDFVLANDRVALAIEDVGVSDEMNPYGGHPIGIAAVREGALTDPADFSEISFTLYLTSVATESVTVLNDGSDGNAAVVRATGPLVPLGFLDFLAVVIPSEIAGLDVAIDYSLAPGAEHVDVHLRLANQTASDALIRQPFLFAFQQNRMPKYAPGFGFDVPIGSDMPWAAFVEDGATSYAFEPSDGELSIFIEQANLLGLLQPRFLSEGCATTDVHLGQIHIGGPGLDGLIAARARTLGQPRHAISGTVTQSDGAPAVGAVVHATSAAGYLTRATTDASGAFVLHVAEPEVTLNAFRRGDAVSDPMNISAPASDLSLSLGASGTLEVTVVDAADQPLPARVQLIPVDGDAYQPPAAWGEPPVTRGRTDVRYQTVGSVTMRVPSEPHRLVVSHGFETEIAVVDVNVPDGGTVAETVRLERVFETPGVMCGDFHMHTNRSFDAEDDVQLKVRAAAAEDLEIPVRSDHEWVGSFEPTIAQLGLTDALYGIGSLELTTFTYGHVGVFPLDADPTARNSGAIDWVDRDPPTVFGDAHSRVGVHGRAEVMINHPRDATQLLGYFNAANFDPSTGMVGRPDLWFEDFVFLEVFNDSDFDSNADGTVRDWFSLLSHGHLTFAVGSSDSHEVSFRGVGYPRTCIELGVDTAAELRPLGAGLVRDRMLEGRSTIVGGVYVEPVARGAVGPGGTVTGAMARESIDVRVRAAPWVNVDRLRVYVNGALAETLTVDASTEDPLDAAVRFDAAIELSLERDAFVVLVADGEGTLEPIHPGRRPFGVSNPIFFER